jgi:hypothetical protein
MSSIRSDSRLLKRFRGQIRGCLKRGAKPDQIDDHPTNEPAKIPHRTAASPDSPLPANRIRFTTGTSLGSCISLRGSLFSFGSRWSFRDFSGAEGVFARRFPLLSETVGRRWSRSTVLTTEPGKTELCLSKGIPEPRHVAGNRGLDRVSLRFLRWRKKSVKKMAR